MNRKQAPLEVLESSSAVRDDRPPDYRRLWVGNLDPRISEYQLLKLMQKHGPIEKFDLLFHRAGPLAGQPRGYAFVTFKDKEDAVAAKSRLHDAVVGTKKVVVTWAHGVNSDEIEKPKPELNIPALAMSKSETRTDRQVQIRAIEAKLKLMEEQHDAGDELVINKTAAAEQPVVAQFQFNRDASASGLKTRASSSSTSSSSKRYDRFGKPYRKHHRDNRR